MIVPEAVKAEYRKRQARAQQLLEERFEHVRSKTDEIDSIEMEKRRIMFEHGQKAFTLDEQAYEADRQSAVEKRDFLNRKKAYILSKLGLPEDYLTIKYTCEACKDTGFLEDGKRCSCMRELLMRYYFDNSLLDESQTFEKYDLNVFKDEKQRNRMKKLYDLALHYADSLPDAEPVNMILLGSTGLGKSFTLNCIAHRAAVRGLDVVRVTAYGMFDRILKAIRNDMDMPDFLSCDLLAIDDLGTEPMMRNITTEQLFSVINEREARRKATIIASNLSPTDLFERYGERVASRLLSQEFGTVVTLYGNDVRLM